MKNRVTLFVLVLLVQFSYVNAQVVDYSVVSVPEESSSEFVCISSDNDYVCMPEVKRSSRSLTWYSNRIVEVSPDGKSLAFLSFRNNTTNLFIKEIEKKSGAIQRTKRQNVTDFSYSPDGKYICFAEQLGRNIHIFQTSAVQGFACRQITEGNQDYNPVYSPDLSQIFFSRQESKSLSIWSYNMKNNFLSSLTSGMNPCVISNSKILCTRSDSDGRCEIWSIDTESGIEECIISDIDKSFTSPSISPDGNYIVLVGSSTLYNGNKKYFNTDIYVSNIDGSGLHQLTYHAADDLSPCWSKDGQYIYFVSQRGSQTGTANIWRMSFNVME